MPGTFRPPLDFPWQQYNEHTGLSGTDFVPFCISRVAITPRLILVVASLVALLTFTGCGSRSGRPTAGLPPPIPAAEPVLLFNGTGTSSSDVVAVEAVLGTLGVGYKTADSTQLSAMSEQQLAGYKL